VLCGHLITIFVSTHTSYCSIIDTQKLIEMIKFILFTWLSTVTFGNSAVPESDAASPTPGLRGLDLSPEESIIPEQGNEATFEAPDVSEEAKDRIREIKERMSRRMNTENNGEENSDWHMKFRKIAGVNPIMGPRSHTSWLCPIRQERVLWEEKDVFNPAAVVKDGMVHMLYRAEDKVISTTLAST
jgi:hypothetical protein